MTTKDTKPKRIKATFYLKPEDIVAVDRMITGRFVTTGIKPQRSEVVSEAIQSMYHDVARLEVER